MLQYDRGSIFNYVPTLYASVLSLIPGEQLILHDTLYAVVLQLIRGFKTFPLDMQVNQCSRIVLYACL